MFEKEAEEYFDKNKFYSKETGTICLRNPLDAFKDGAEFGYKLAHEEMDYLNKHWGSEEERKANEWHYVKDELPKESKKYYVYSEEWGVEISKFIADAGCFECRNFLIIAWKEIVLPELKESE